MGGVTSTATPIPVTPGESPERPEAPERTSTVKGNGRVLVVDDDQSTCELIAASLEKHGFDVDWLTRATDALEAVKERDYDLVLTDLLMDDMEGSSSASGSSAPSPICQSCSSPVTARWRRRSAPSASARTTSSPSRST